MLKNRFKKILVAIDGSSNSIRGMNEAISLARQSEGTIHGIYVLPGFPSELTSTLSSYRKHLLEKTRKFMSNAKTSAARHGIDFEEKIITSNDTVNAIANFAKREKFDIIVIGARGEGSPKSEYFGSVSNGILHSSRIPILIIK